MDEPGQKVEKRCGHGHGPLIELPDMGLRCPACFPGAFVAEVGKLRGELSYALKIVDRIPEELWERVGLDEYKVGEIRERNGWLPDDGSTTEQAERERLWQCKCGHVKRDHSDHVDDTRCLVMSDTGIFDDGRDRTTGPCECLRFRPADTEE